MLAQAFILLAQASSARKASALKVLLLALMANCNKFNMLTELTIRSLPIWALIGGLWTLYGGFECPVKHCCLKHLASHTSDQRLLHFLGTIHDVEALGDSWSMSTVIQRLLASHWPHLSLVLEWFGGIMLHVTLQGNC